MNKNWNYQQGLMVSRFRAMMAQEQEAQGQPRSQLPNTALYTKEPGIRGEFTQRQRKDELSTCHVFQAEKQEGLKQGQGYEQKRTQKPT